jgi:hypothetical protein
MFTAGAQGNASEHGSLGPHDTQCHDLSIVSLRALLADPASTCWTWPPSCPTQPGLGDAGLLVRAEHDAGDREYPLTLDLEIPDRERDRSIALNECAVPAGDMVLRLTIAPEGIAELVRLGWLARLRWPASYPGNRKSSRAVRFLRNGIQPGLPPPRSSRNLNSIAPARADPGNRKSGRAVRFLRNGISRGCRRPEDPAI